MVVVVVVFTLNRSFYPTATAVHPVSVLIIHATSRDRLCGYRLYTAVRQRKPKKNGELIKVGKVIVSRFMFNARSHMVLPYPNCWAPGHALADGW